MPGRETMEKLHGKLSKVRRHVYRSASDRVWKPVRISYATAGIALLAAVGFSHLVHIAETSGHSGTLPTVLHLSAIGCWVVAGISWGLASSMALVHVLVQWLVPPRGAP